MNCLGRLAAGTGVVAFGGGDVLGFFLRGVFAGLGTGLGVVCGSGSSTMSKNTGLPCSKELFSESESENPSEEEEEIS